MRRSFGFWAFVVVLLTGVALAGVVRNPVNRMPMKNLPVISGARETTANRPITPPRPLPYSSSLDSVGTAYIAGDTYWDAQHNGSVGKMIGVDSLGYVHMVWTKGEDQVDQNRNVYYNCWDPATTNFVTMSGSVTGVAINSSPRAGYTTLAVTPGGWAFPAFHERLNGETTLHSSAAMDFQRRFGAFISSQPGRCQEAGAPIEIVWPKIAIGQSNTIHMVSTESPASDDPGHWQRIYYSRGTPFWIGDQGLGIEWDQLECGGFTLIDTAMVISPIIVASKTSPRVAIVWSHSRDNILDTADATQYNNDLYYKLSEDDGLNWGANLNLTNFIAALDTFPQMWVDSLQAFVNDTARANKDTNRVYTDCDAIFDNNDNLHVAFTTQNYWTWEGTISRWFSEVWHWSEGQPDEFTHVAGMRFKQITDSTIEVCWPINLGGDGHHIGAWQRMTQRPSLALDETTGYLYCAYQWYDPLQRSDDDAGWPMADILVAVSRNCGRSWTDSINVTSSGMLVDSLCNPAPAGESLSERDVSIADRITYQDGVGYIQMAYEIDRDCGTYVQDPPEGTITLNPIVYRRIPVNSLPQRPIHDPGHVPFHCDSTGFPGRINPFDPEGVAICGAAVDPNAPTLRPQSFHLYQNYPNPFNPVTNIQFDLSRNARVTLKVFNVMGQEVATLFNNKMLSAGAQNITFDASNLASGVYVYRIEADGHSQSLKMVLMK